MKKFRPRDGRLVVPLHSQVAVRFSRPIELSSCTSETALLRTLSGDRVAVSYSTEQGGKLLVMTPAERLTAGTDYQIVVRPGILSNDGRTLRAERTSYFFTDPQVFLPPILRPDQFAPVETAMVEGRAAHSATLLASGDVLLAGGMSDYTNFAVSGDLFDPDTSAFRGTGGQLAVARSYHAATRLAEGAILVGGLGVAGSLDSTEVYLPSATGFSAGPRLLEERDFVAATTLRDGRVLVVGGLHYTAQGAFYSDTAEIYAPGGDFRFTLGAPIARRAGHTLTVLADGRVLVVGGQSTSALASAELFDPETETFTTTAFGPQFHRQLHTATLLADTGLVLFADGGSALLEVYDVASDSFFPAGGASSVNRTGATANLLRSGEVLFAGGLEDRGENDLALDGFDLYRRSGGEHGSVLRLSVVFPEPRYGHTGTTLPDDRVLYAGGFGQAAPDSLRSGILFTPDQP